jgi:hypothetical protein
MDIYICKLKNLLHTIIYIEKSTKVVNNVFSMHFFLYNNQYFTVRGQVKGYNYSNN